jgi:hypothetical protein
MAQFSVEIIRLPGSLLGGNQHREDKKACKAPYGLAFSFRFQKLDYRFVCQIV